MQALGIVEVRSLVGAVEAADTMLKSADVHLVDLEYVGSGFIAVIVRGDVAAVSAAVENGKENAKRISQVISTNIIARPHYEVDKIL